MAELSLSDLMESRANMGFGWTQSRCVVSPCGAIEHTVFAVIAFIAAFMCFMVYWHRAGDVSQAKTGRLSEGRRHVGYEHVHGEVAISRCRRSARGQTEDRPHSRTPAIIHMPSDLRHVRYWG